MLTGKMKWKKLQEVDLDKFMRSRGLNQSFQDVCQALLPTNLRRHKLGTNVILVGLKFSQIKKYCSSTYSFFLFSTKKHKRVDYLESSIANYNKDLTLS